MVAAARARGELSLYDAAEAPLDRARERLLAHGLRAHLHVRDAWAEPDRPVDGLFTGFWLSHVARAAADFLALARRWLVPGGRSRSSTRCPIRRRAPPIDPPRRTTLRPPPRRRPRVHDRQGLLRPGWSGAALEAGFEDVEVTTGRFFLLGSRAGAVTAPGPPTARRAERPRYTPADVPLANRTIATVGSGVMAEAMIAGLLRAARRARAQVVASHPRPERREELEREYGIRTVAANVEAIATAPTSSCSRSSPRCSTGSAARSGRTCGAASSCCRSSPARRRPR